MFGAFYFAVGLLAFLPHTYGVLCGDNICLNDDTQDAYCCGVDNFECCYVTRVVNLWWFWLVLVFSIVFFSVCIVAICCRQRRSRHGYVVVRGETRAPTIVTTQVAATSTNYGGVPQAHQGYKAFPPATHGYPPAYSQHPPPYG